MAQLPEAYLTNQEDSDESVFFPPVPAGNHVAIIESSDYDYNKEKTGKNLKLVWQIIEGPSKNSKLFEYLCLEHPKIDTMQQAWRTFNKINDICGYSQEKRAKDSSLLHNIPMIIEVECKINETFPNSIKKHLPIKGDAPNIQQPQKSVNQPEEVPAPTKSPWEKI